MGLCLLQAAASAAAQAVVCAPILIDIAVAQGLGLPEIDESSASAQDGDRAVIRAGRLDLYGVKVDMARGRPKVGSVAMAAAAALMECAAAPGAGRSAEDLFIGMAQGGKLRL